MAIEFIDKIQPKAGAFDHIVDGAKVGLSGTFTGNLAGVTDAEAMAEIVDDLSAGSSGVSGYSGLNGASGISGYSGVSGYSEVSFEAPDLVDRAVTIDAAYVDRMLADIVKSDDLSRYIL